MLFVIIGQDVANSLDTRRRVRPRHLERMRALIDQGRLVLAGPMPAVPAMDPGPAGYSGSVIVAEFESIEAARQWIADDPYVTEGVFVSHDVRPFVQALP